MRQNGPKTAGERAQNSGRGSKWAASLLKLISEGSCAGHSHCAGREVGVLGRFGVNFSRFSSGEFRARFLNGRVTAA